MVYVLQSHTSLEELWKETQRKAATLKLRVGSSLLGNDLAQVPSLVFLPVTVQ